MAESPYDFKAALIQEVKDHPVLWKGEHEKYGDRFRTAVAWRDIARKLQVSEYILRAKWKNLRDTFRSVIKKSDITHVGQYTGTWKYFHLISFIKDELKDEGLIEFIVETDEENTDNESEISHSTRSKNNNESEFLTRNNMTDDESFKSNCDGRLNEISGNQSINDEEIIRYIDKREYDDHIYHGKPKENDDDIPSKRQKTSDGHENYDVMFLKSLAPYFKQLDPLKKLVMRSRIQNVLLNEIAKQNYL